MSLVRLWSFVPLVSFAFLSVLSDESKPQACKDAQKVCRDSTMCAGNLFRMFLDCKESLAFDDDRGIITGPMLTPCSLRCVYAIGNLTSQEPGRALETCDCGTDAMCLTLKSRMQKCVDMASGRYNASAERGCTEARLACDDDAQCHKMQMQFLLDCTDMISGVKCTNTCKKSRDKFLTSALGKAMNSCECDDLEEHICRGIRAHHLVLCVRDPRRSIEAKSTLEPATRSQGRLTANAGLHVRSFISWFLIGSSTILCTTSNIWW